MFDVSHHRHLQVLLHKTVICATWSPDDDDVNWAIDFQEICFKCYVFLSVVTMFGLAIHFTDLKVVIISNWSVQYGYCRSVTYTKSYQHSIAAKLCRYKLIVAVCFCSIQHRAYRAHVVHDVRQKRSKVNFYFWTWTVVRTVWVGVSINWIQCKRCFIHSFASI